MGYCVISDLTLRYGTPNLTMWAALEGDNSSANIALRWQAGIDRATAQINTLLMRSGYAVPLQFLDAYATAFVNDWCIDLAAYYIYEARGHSDEDKSDNKLEKAREKAIGEIMRVRAGVITLNCARRWGNNPNCATVV